MRTILVSPEFRAPDVLGAKTKTPFEYVVAALRVTDADVVNAGVPGDTAAAALGRLPEALAYDPWLVIEASTRFADKRREVRVHGELGVAVLPRDDVAALRLERGDEVTAVPFRPEPPLRRELAAFLEHLRGGPPPKSGAAEGVAVVEALVALRELAGR